MTLEKLETAENVKLCQIAVLGVVHRFPAVEPLVRSDKVSVLQWLVQLGMWHRLETRARAYGSPAQSARSQMTF